MLPDIWSSHDNMMIIAGVPGMHPDGLDLTLQRSSAMLGGTIRDVMDAENTENVTWCARELTRGTFRRIITLPFAVDADNAAAEIARLARSRRRLEKSAG